MKPKVLATVNIGYPGIPGSPASEIVCEIEEIRSGRYEVTGYYSIGINQEGYYLQNYKYGPWRGRGNYIDDAIRMFLNIVPENYYKCMKEAAQEAQYEAEDYLEIETEDEKEKQEYLKLKEKFEPINI